MADVYATGTVNSGSQQQWMSRNSHFGKWNGGNFNMVFSGCVNAPSTHCGYSPKPYTNVQATPLIAEKPFITEKGGKFSLNIPHVEKNKVGTSKDWGNFEKVGFEHVYVAHAGDSAATITSKIDQGLHVVIQPGNYYLSDSIKVNKPNAVILGIGMATLISNTGKPCIEVGNVEGVRVAGLLLQAGPHKTPSLLKWGSSKNPGSSSNPGVASDVFARVGGRNNQYKEQAYAETMFEINSGNVIIDNTWLWRADHAVGGGVRNSMNPVQNGLVVNGDNVITYGLAVEHTLGHMTLWNGNHGLTIFYQSELPYDVDSGYASKHYAGYKVADHVTSHRAYGVGVYSFFRDHTVDVENGISAPNHPGVQFTNSFNKFLSGHGSIKHVINGQGSAARGGHTINFVCNYGSHGLMDLQDLQNIHPYSDIALHPRPVTVGLQNLKMYPI